MHPIDTFFEEYAKSCAKIYNACIPWSLVILVASFAVEFYRGFETRRMLMFLAKIFFIILLTAKSADLINSGQQVVESFLNQTGLVRPESVAETYKARLAATMGEPDIKDKSIFRLMITGHFFDSLVYFFLLGVSYVALFVVTLITYAQKAALLLCWSVAPVLFAFIAFEPWAGKGKAHINRLVAIISWPLSFAIAATFTDALLNMALKNDFLARGSVIKTLEAAAENLVILAAIGVWDVISTIFAPFFIHRFIVSEGGSTGSLAQSIFQASVVVSAVKSTYGGAKSVYAYAAKKLSGGKTGGSGSGEKASPTTSAPPPPSAQNSSTKPASGSPVKQDSTRSQELQSLIQSL